MDVIENVTGGVETNGRVASGDEAGEAAQCGRGWVTEAVMLAALTLLLPVVAYGVAYWYAAGWASAYAIPLTWVDVGPGLLASAWAAVGMVFYGIVVNSLTVMVLWEVRVRWFRLFLLLFGGGLMFLACYGIVEDGEARSWGVVAASAFVVAAIHVCLTSRVEAKESQVEKQGLSGKLRRMQTMIVVMSMTALGGGNLRGPGE